MKKRTIEQVLKDLCDIDKRRWGRNECVIATLNQISDIICAELKEEMPHITDEKGYVASIMMGEQDGIVKAVKVVKRLCGGKE